MPKANSILAFNYSQRKTKIGKNITNVDVFWKQSNEYREAYRRASIHYQVLEYGWWLMM